MEQYKLHKYLLKYGLCEDANKTIYNDKIDYYKNLCLKNGIMIGGAINKDNFAKSVKILVDATNKYALDVKNEAHKKEALKALEDVGKHLSSISSSEDIALLYGQIKNISSSISKMGKEAKPILSSNLKQVKQTVEKIPVKGIQMSAAKMTLTTALATMINVLG